MRSIHWATPPYSHTRSSLQFSYPSLVLLLSIGLRRWVAFWKALKQLYRLVMVARHNINLLSIDSTREGVGIRISSPKSKSKIQILTKEKQIDVLTSTTAVIVINNINDNIKSSISLAWRLTRICSTDIINYCSFALRLTCHHNTHRRWCWTISLLQLLRLTAHSPPPQQIHHHHRRWWWIVTLYPPPQQHPPPTTISSSPPPPNNDYFALRLALVVVGDGCCWRWWWDCSIHSSTARRPKGGELSNK